MFPAKLPCQLQSGHVLNGKYQIEEELGSGGFGCVYAAENLNLHTRVAIKLRREPGPDARLWREAQLAAALQSPHSVRIFDVDRLDDGTPYIVMEFLEGQTLRDYLRQVQKAPLERAVTWALQICSALGEAHAAGLVHRDIKPSNLFLVKSSHADGHIKLVDFGLAKNVEHADYDTVTDSDVVVGSPAYMAPERVRAGVGTAQADIWSLGVVLFEMLSGKLPFEGETNSALLAAIVADPPRPLLEVAPELPPALGAVIARCLRKRPDDRYASVATLAHDLRQFEADSPARVPSDESVTVSATIARRPARANAPQPGPSRGRLLFLLGLVGVPLMVWLFSRLGAPTPTRGEDGRGAPSVQGVRSGPAPATPFASASAVSTSVREPLGPAQPLRPAAHEPARKQSGPAERPTRADGSAEAAHRATQASAEGRAAPAAAASVRARSVERLRSAGSASASSSAGPRLFTEPDF